MSNVGAGKEDVAQMMDDLGSLSDPMRLSHPSSADERWRWLQPWTWILGAWSHATRRQDEFVLDVTVRGAGLHACSSVRVRISVFWHEHGATVFP